MLNVGYIHWANANALVINVAIPVFLPASNVNGMLIRRMSFTVAGLGLPFPIPCFEVGLAAPATILINPILTTDNFSNYNAGTSTVSGSCETPFLIPAGYGLWFICNNAIANNIESVSYTPL